MRGRLGAEDRSSRRGPWRLGGVGLATRATLALAMLVAWRAEAQDKTLVIPKEAPQMQRGTVGSKASPSVQVDLGAQKLDRLKVLSTSGEGWKEQGAIPLKSSIGNTATVVVPPNQQVLLKPSEDSPHPVAALSANKLALPGLLVANSASLAQSEAKVSSFRLFIQAREVPLRWNDASRAYETRLVVGVDDEGNAASATPSPTPSSCSSWVAIFPASSPRWCASPSRALKATPPCGS